MPVVSSRYGSNAAAGIVGIGRKADVSTDPEVSARAAIAREEAEGMYSDALIDSCC